MCIRDSADTAWTNQFEQGEEIVIPLKNADGGFIADAETLKRLEGEGQVAFRYRGVNPNGSLDDIAGLTNAQGNVVGLMPHPEHAVEPGFGPVSYTHLDVYKRQVSGIGRPHRF